MKKQLRIVLYEPSGSGGICHYTYQLAEALAALGIHTTLFTTGSYELRHLKRTFHLHINIKGSSLKIFWQTVKIWFKLNHERQGNTIASRDGNYKRARQVSRSLDWFLMLRRWGTRLKAVCSFLFERPHIIHFQWLMNPREDYYFIRLLQFLKFNVVYTAHNLLPHSDNSDITRGNFKRIYQKVDKIIVHAARNKIQLIEEFHLNQEKITVIPHGSYDFFLTDTRPSKEAARYGLKFKDDEKIILFFGGIRINKGLEYLIEAFQEVKADINGAVLLVAGKLSKKRKTFDYYSSLVEKLQDSDVVFINQYIPVERVAYYFAASDVVALPYIQVYQSGVLLLAYASGKPVVVTDTGGMSEIVEEGKSGFVVPPRNAKALAHAIIKILRDIDRTEAMGRHAKYLAETTYSWKNIALKTSDLYRSISTSHSCG